jgi:hypothetical protein
MRSSYAKQLRIKFELSFRFEWNICDVSLMGPLIQLRLLYGYATRAVTWDRGKSYK